MKNKLSSSQIIAMILLLLGIVLILSSLYNGFWAGEYAKATFHGLAGFAITTLALNSGN